MKVIVFGGDGFCGWPTSLKLSASGHEVVIVDNLLRRKIDEELKVGPLTPIKSISERIKDKNGLTIAMDIEFPHDDFLDNKGINWNGRWECNGCNGVISPSGAYFAYDTEMMDLTSEGFNWEAFWNR